MNHMRILRIEPGSDVLHSPCVGVIERNHLEPWFEVLAVSLVDHGDVQLVVPFHLEHELVSGGGLDPDVGPHPLPDAGLLEDLH